jgi:hypothetical protein
MAIPKGFPTHLHQFLENIQEVERLLAIHRGLTGRTPGRKVDVEVLNKSAIVLLVACWEAFVEDIASSALDFMISNARNHSAFPQNVLERVASKHSGPRAWDLAGDGWKTALRDNYASILAKTAGTLNTPRAAQVNDLFVKTIGLSDLSSCWYWKGRTNGSAVAALDRLITLRGAIAHRVRHSHAVQKRTVTANAHLVNFLAARSSNHVRDHVHGAVGRYPWIRVTYRNVG